MALTCSLIMLPLNSNKRLIESTLRNFLELVKLYNPKQLLDLNFKKNLDTIFDDSKLNHHMQSLFLAKYLNEFPLLKRLKFDYLAEKVEKKQVSMVQIKKNKLVEISPTSKYVYLVMNGKIILRQH